jgi:hypothetical protein
MSGEHDNHDDANRLHTEFWDDAGALMKEIMDDFAFTKPVRVSLRDVQARIRFRLAQAAETRETALREARAEIERLQKIIKAKDIEIESYKAEISYRIELLKDADRKPQ